MLAYAANRPVVAERRSAPNAMLAIIALHVAGVAALMSARMDLPARIMNDPIVVDLVNAPKPPPEQPVESREPQPRQSTMRPPAQIPVPVGDPEIAASTPHVHSFDDLVGPKVDPPRADPRPLPAPVSIGPKLATPASELRPAYPRSKLASGEEAVLRLRLTIDERGRVVAVEPAGPAEATFLEAARRHLIARWRYRPATEGGRSVPSSTVITLRFQLEG